MYYSKIMTIGIRPFTHYSKHWSLLVLMNYDFRPGFFLAKNKKKEMNLVSDVVIFKDSISTSVLLL